MPQLYDHGRPILELRPYTPKGRDPLEVPWGLVLRYEEPAAPVGDDDWQALQ